MPTKTITQILDSFDGKEIDPDTRPITLTVDRRQWKLYLSAANAKKFFSQIEKWTESESESVASQSVNVSGSGSRRSPSRSAGVDLGQVRSWAKDHGYEIADRGRVSAEIMEAYRAAN